MLSSVLLLLALLGSSFAVNFDWENVQLTEAETRNYTDIRFGGFGSNSTKRECKFIPGDTAWPTDAEWARFNETLGGSLLKPLPLAVVCYNGLQYDAERCERLKKTWTSMDLHANDPISVMSQWSTGSSCVPTSNTNSTCTQGGYPVYVVNATTARHVQLAINFARNRNIRLTVKNSGHDFNGKSIGGHTLSVWVHNLKGYVFHENYSSPGYSGKAVAYAGGLQSQDTGAIERNHKVMIITAGGPSVGIAGGFLQAGGHSSYTSYYGLAADHVLSIQVVIASGDFVTADATQNRELFWALRGGGPGNYGIITSVIVKAFSPTTLTSGDITFSTIPARGSNQSISLDTFWAGMRAHWGFVPKIVNAGGLGYNFIRHTRSGNTTGLTFTTNIRLPNVTFAEARAFLRPHLEELKQLGIPVPIPNIKRTLPDNLYASSPHHPRAPVPRTPYTRRELGDTVGHILIASRLFHRTLFTSNSSLEALNSAIRTMVDASAGNYTFHGMNYAPTTAVAGFPYNAVNPAFRTTMMHAQAYEEDAWWDGMSPQKTVSEQKRRHDRLQGYMDRTWKRITPGGGSYQNEGDAMETDWKQAFYGRLYGRLAGIKEEWDPEGVFWVVGGVGSDGWEVRDSSGGGRKGVFTQDGRLCRTQGKI